MKTKPNHQETRAHIRPQFPHFAVQRKKKRQLCLCLPDYLNKQTLNSGCETARKYMILRRDASPTRCCFPVAVSPRNNIVYGTTASPGTKGGTLKLTKRRRSTQEQKKNANSYCFVIVTVSPNLFEQRRQQIRRNDCIRPPVVQVQT